MKQDRFGYFYESQEEPRLTKSSQVRARSTINYRLQDNEVDTVMFDEDLPTTPRATRPQPRKDDHMIDEYKRRNRQLPSTNEDHTIHTTRAYQLPRYRMELPTAQPTPTPRAQKPVTRRKALYAIGVSAVALTVGGVFVKSKVDAIVQREQLGQYGFIIKSIVLPGTKDTPDHPTKLSTWIEADYIIRLDQVPHSDDALIKRTVSSPVSLVYHGPIDQVIISLTVQQQDSKLACIVKMSPLDGSDGFVMVLAYNGQYFV